MELQILDCDYVMVNNKPVIRLFCKNAQGESVCVFYDKFMPYFYLYGDEKNYQDITARIKKKYQNLKIDVVEKFLPVGFQPSVKVLKITGTEPAQTPEIKEFVKSFGTPYEADILFRYRFMSDFDLRGMSWIEVEGKPTKTGTVKCKAIMADSIKPIEIIKNAPMKYLSLDIECLPDEPRIAVPEKDKIIAVSLVFNPAYKGKDSLVILAKHARSVGNILPCVDEKQMLEKLKDVINDYDPDIIAGYNINNFDLPFILGRMDINKVQRDLGRSEKVTIARKLQQSYMTNICGRVIVDAFEIIKRDPWVKFKRYDLDTVAKQMVGQGKIDLRQKGNFLEVLREIWGRSDVSELVEYAQRDSELVMRILLEKRLLDKFLEVAKVCGLLLQDCLGGQSQRHEFRLLKDFYKRNYIMPCKPDSVGDREKGHSLKGAFVLEPEVGLHEWIICLDFTSMYPSLIRAFNICTTTLITNGSDADHIVTPYGTKFVKPTVLKGVLPSLVDEMLGARVVVKKQAELETDPENKRILKAKNLALKDLSNSLYGYTGYVRSRLYVMDIANTITALGRDTIAKTKELIETNYPVKVIYADTDSVFIKSKNPINSLEEAETFGRNIAKFVSGNLPGMDLKFEKVYKSFLIEAKKRYAGWAFEKERDKWVDKIDMKGIETVRRDWCLLVSQTMLDILNIILKERDVKKASKHVREVITDLAGGKVPVEKLTVVKGITKSIESYDGVQPHIELAKKIAQRDKTRSLVGERLEYVIVRGNQLVSKRAEDPEFVKEKHLEIDSEYYVHNQLLPPLERIFEVCGVSQSELIEGVKQKNLMDLFAQPKQLSPDEIVLKSFESIVCKSCGWEFRRPSLSGSCPKCQGQLYFSSYGSMGKTVELVK